MSSSQQDLHLWKLPRGRHGLSREIVARSQRERLIAAVVHVTATKSYLAANDVLIGNLLVRVAAAYGQSGAWPARVRLGLGASLEWLAADPEVARVMMIEMGAVGPVAAERFRQTFHGLAKLLDDDKELTDDASVDLPNLTRIAGAAVFAQIYEEVALGDIETLPRLLPELTFALLLPFVGEAIATKEKKAAEKEAAPA